MTRDLARSVSRRSSQSSSTPSTPTVRGSGHVVLVNWNYSRDGGNEDDGDNQLFLSPFCLQDIALEDPLGNLGEVSRHMMFSVPRNFRPRY